MDLEIIMKLRYRLASSIFVLVIIVILTSHSILLSKDNNVIQQIGTVQINWTDQVITATATSMPTITDTGNVLDTNTLQPISINTARSKAYTDAKEKALEFLITTLGTIKVDPFRTLAEFIEHDEFTQTKLGLLSNDINYQYKPKGLLGAQCWVRLPMGKLLKLLPEALPSKDMALPAVTLPATEYTGCIIDTRGFKVTPMLFPSLYAEDGTEIFGKDFIDSNSAWAKGTVAYCYADDIALKHNKAGRLPYYCAAINVCNNCPVIANTDLRKITASKITRNNLKNGNIVIIIDRE
ncbi:MAG: hypothetical protein ACUVRK_06175 [Spirochaetota bacterium]